MDVKTADKNDNLVGENEKTTYTIRESEDGYLHEDNAPVDLFVPFKDLPEANRVSLTVRAVVVGVICGVLVGASNIYLGLKSGWTFSANIFATLVGFAILKPLSRAATSLPFIGGEFNHIEHNYLQTVATAASGLGNAFVGGVPAMYQLNLMSPTPKEDMAKLITLTVVGGFFGIAMSTPLRKFFIIYIARDLRLIFPSPTAVATTIRSMHEAASGEAMAKLKMRMLSAVFAVSLVLRVVSQYAIGILWDWHVFTWFYIWSGYKNHALAVENWGWYIEWTPAFVGAGLLVGLNTAISFFGGSVLAWGIIGPILVRENVAFGKAIAADDPQWSPLISYYSLSGKYSTATHPSPRFWLLWPGVLLMITVSFVELALQYKIFIHVAKVIIRGTSRAINDALTTRGRSSDFLQRQANKEIGQDISKDSATEDEQVKWWMWSPLLVLSIIGFLVVLKVEFGMPVGPGVLSVILAFFFSFLAVQCTGATDITPLTAASKASQIILGGVTKGEGWTTPQAQKLNLVGGVLASFGANQASDLTGDFRVGFLLRTPPKIQWIAQCLGTVAAVFAAPGLFVLFAQAYPCILDVNAETCAFAAPSVSAWRAVAEAMTAKDFPVPRSSGIFAIVLSIVGGAVVLFRHFALRGKYERYRVYLPNMMCIGLAFVVPQTIYGTAMLIGATIAYIWQWRNPKSWENYGYAAAAGAIAGEGIGGVVNAIFQLANIAGPDPFGTQIGCPGLSC